MENKLTKEGVIRLSETFLHPTKSLQWIKHAIEIFGVFVGKRGFQEMNLYQIIALILGIITLLVLEHIYGIRLCIVVGVTGITLVVCFALMYIGKK